MINNDLGLLKNTHVLKKHWSFHDFEKNWMIVKKNQKHLLKWKFWTKKHDVQYFWNAPSVMFLDYPKQPFLGCFCFFLMRERPILTVLKQMISDEIKQSNSIKPPKNQLFHDFF